MVRFRGVRAVLFLGTACALTACGDEQADNSTTTCHIEVTGHLEDAGAKKKDVEFVESEVNDEVDGIWIVSGTVEVAGRTGDYECRVVDSELDKERGKRIADVKIAPQLLREYRAGG